MGREQRANGGKATMGQLQVVIVKQQRLIRTLQEQVELASRVLCAIALDPDAFRHADGLVTVDGAAVQRVTTGTTVNIQQQDGVVALIAMRPTEDTTAASEAVLAPVLARIGAR